MLHPGTSFARRPSTLAWLAEYVNLKQAYNHPRLVELARGSLTRTAYEWTDTTLARLGDPRTVAVRLDVDF